MNEQVKQDWIKALRSGEYKQTKTNLRKDDCYCAYGVLCDLYGKEKNINWGKDKLSPTPSVYSFMDMWGCPPDEVFDWAGLSDKGLGLNAATRALAKKKDQVVHLNDKHGASFSEIADYIEKNL